jgi:prevent-host-death family protein
MKETTVGASEFKAKCLSILDQVATRGARVVITKRGRPVAELVPVKSAIPPLRDSWKGKGEIVGDIVNFNEADDWEENQ